MYDYDYHSGQYSAQVLDFKFAGDSLWLIGVDYTRRDFFDIDVKQLQEKYIVPYLSERKKEAKIRISVD